jgi:hypothetical protein
MTETEAALADALDCGVEALTPLVAARRPVGSWAALGRRGTAGTASAPHRRPHRPSSAGPSPGR